MNVRDERIKIMLAQLPLRQQDSCALLWAENAERFALAPGSQHKHQAWPGGYLDHVHDTMTAATLLYPRLAPRLGVGLPFVLPDALLVMFLHDLEKPWRYVEEKVSLPTKVERRSFRMTMIDQAGFALTPEQENALLYVEGEGDDYRGDRRIMTELASFCHMCDVASAGIFHSRSILSVLP